MRLGNWAWLTASAAALASAAQAGENVTYSYDALGRLVATSSTDTVNPGVTSSIGYDAAGNRSIYAASVSGPPSFSVSEATALEGGGLLFTVVKNGTGAASVSYGTASGSAGGGDFTGVSGGLEFAAGESRKTVAVATIDDSSDEPSETLLLNLAGPSAGSTIADGQGIGTIFDNDEPPPPPPPPPPSFSVSDASATEGGALVFTVTKTGAAIAVFGIGFATANNTASANALGGPYIDYYASSGNLYFLPNETSKTITIQGSDDPLDESNETFHLNLSTLPGGATISDGQGVGTIVDNDDPPPPPPPGNTAPTAVNDTGSMLRCSSKTFDVLANDSDADGAIDLPLTVVGVAGTGFSFTSTQVTVDSQFLSSGDYGYYTVRDQRGAQSTAILTITLNGSGNCGA
ncbi:MAG TPA: Calx-beta domain-containing protein [Allosphingosinicella sp.]|nr:Calx-beta domain-containing protein [Allosphingosinicella sp.]